MAVSGSNNKKSTVFLGVDFLSTGKYLPEAAAKFFARSDNPDYKDVEIVHVLSHAEQLDAFKGQYDYHQERGVVKETITYEPALPLEPEDPNDILQYRQEVKLAHEEELKRIMDYLNEKYNVLHVVAGTEGGVELADRLSERLSLESTNGTALSSTRRNKFDMHEALKKNGVRAMQHRESSDLEEILRFARLQPGFMDPVAPVPVVVKPVADAATNNVIFCYNEEKIREAFKRILGSKTVLNDENTTVLAQGYLPGEEFMVNLMCREVDGEEIIFPMDVWQECKKVHKGKNDTDSKSLIYEREEVLHWNDPRYEEVVAYAKLVAKALGIKNGPAHIEVKRNSLGQLVLVEAAARLPGGTGLDSYDRIFGYNPVDLMILAYNAPQAFKAFVTENEKKRQQHPRHEVDALNIFLIATKAGTIQRSFTFEQLKKHCPTLFEFKAHLEKGDELDATDSLLNSPGYFYLIGTKEEIERDRNRFRKLEEEGLYEELTSPVGILESELSSSPGTHHALTMSLLGTTFSLAPAPRKKAVVLVGPYSSGDLEAREWRRAMQADPQYRDVALICVHPKKDIPKNFQGTVAKARVDKLYDDEISFTGENLQEVLTFLAQYDVERFATCSEIAVAPGMEIGVALKQKLLQEQRDVKFKLNDPSSAETCRNKKVMHDTLRKNGLAAITDRLSANKAEILEFAKNQLALTGKVVLKPKDSASSDNVFIPSINDETEGTLEEKTQKTLQKVAEAFDKILASKNRAGNQNTDVLAQEYLDGREFIINFVANDDTGTFYVADILEQFKVIIDNTPNYRYEKPLSHDDPLFKAVTDYVNQARKAMGVKYGAGHFEVKCTSDGRIVLIEGAARLGGGMNPDQCDHTFGHNPVSLSVQSRLYPEKFKQYGEQPRPPLQDTFYNIFMISEEQGVITKPFFSDDELRTLFPTYHSKDVHHLELGSALEKTVNYSKCPGMLSFVGSAEAVECDYQKYLTLEKQWFKDMVKPLENRRTADLGTNGVSVAARGVGGIHAVSSSVLAAVAAAIVETPKLQ